MTGSIVALGELMVRLKPPGKLRLRQANVLEICHGGAEANVVVSLANFGMPTRFVSALPEGELGEHGLATLRSSGVDTTHVVRRAGRMGLYFMEEGADLRSGCVIYDRANSAFAELQADRIDWNEVFDGAAWFHVSGITPAISPTTRDLAYASVREAKLRSIHVSVDLNYRDRLWGYGTNALDVMPELVERADTLIAGRGDCSACLGFTGKGEEGSDQWVETLADEALQRFPSLRNVAVTIRSSRTAEEHAWRAYLRAPTASAFSRAYEMSHIVDRVGTGDAFTAGIIYGLANGLDAETTVSFAAAANCLKHTIAGDANIVTVSEVEALAAATSFGMLRR